MHLYPGGSQANYFDTSYDWVNNYWCDLLSPQNERGEVNRARPYAIISSVILCFSVLMFLFQLSNFLYPSGGRKKLMQGSAVVSLVLPVFLFTRYHDQLIVVFTLTSIVLLWCIGHGILLKASQRSQMFAILALVLFLTTTAMYFFRMHLRLLPLFQKVTFGAFLLWMIDIAFLMRALNRK